MNVGLSRPQTILVTICTILVFLAGAYTHTWLYAHAAEEAHFAMFRQGMLAGAQVVNCHAVSFIGGAAWDNASEAQQNTFYHALWKEFPTSCPEIYAIGKRIFPPKE